ncbi:GTP cyclohydrolase II [Salinibacter altiplanensis]|uniref:GTP cyclohydrolase II n=1 Tax=Salinibacter altiplanensis TaxID=1803181 RepID=UPI000C9EEB39|nr:GTP cyclohydrolase II [Salinibacter altiplanensis]
MDSPSVQRLTGARIPTVDGEFTLFLYENSEDDKDHLALVCGDVEGHNDVLVRAHSECFTGDVLGSLRCDCGEQLDTSMRRVAEEGQGVILYLRQEGRGIGLQSKLRAYNLQDEGYDTVEANRMLGHEADERDYTIAATILEDLGVSSVRLLTNNPGKVEDLTERGIDITKRAPLKPHVNQHNEDYLRTKVDRMRHILDLGPANGHSQGNAHASSLQSLEQRMERHFGETDTPFVTLTYAQSLDGSIASEAGTPLPISGKEALDFTHRLRALHDGILVGIGTVLSDDPRLNVRRGETDHPIPIVLDSSLRCPPDAQLLTCEGPDPLIFTAPDPASDRREALTARGATIHELPCAPNGGVCLDSLLEELGGHHVTSVMVEGGTQVLTAFLRRQQAQRIIVTVAPMFVGGTPALGSLAQAESADAPDEFPHLTHVQQRWYGDDLVVEGDPVWPASD